MPWLFKAGLILAALYLIGALMLYFLQRRMMFSPDQVRVSPEAVNIPGLHEVPLKTPDGHALYSWHLPAKSGRPTLLFFHGNGGNVANREEKFRQLSAAGYGVFMLGYRGFGGSDGVPGERVLVQDSGLAYDYLTGLGLAPSQIVIYGESIGTSIAVQLAAKVNAAALILEAPMYSVLSIAEARYPYLPVRFFLNDKFETNRFISKVSAPLLVIHGSEDGVIPLASGRALFDEAPEPKRFEVLVGAGHNNIYDFPIVDVIVDFLKSHDIDS